MTVENANFISQLNKSYPRNRDLIKEGDDHIRLTKSVLQSTFPGIDRAVNATADKLNKLDATFDYESDEITIKSSLILGSNKTIDLGGAVLEGVGDPKEGTDAVNLQSLQGTLMWPVGSVFLTVDSRNPSEILGFGNWEKFAAGRFLMGTGTSTDINNEVLTVVNEGRGGGRRAKLTGDHLPEHTHAISNLKTAEGGAHSHNVDVRVHSYAITNGNYWTTPEGNIAGENSRFNNTQGAKTQSDGAHTHEITGDVSAAGKGESFEILPPYIACNMWVRRADTRRL